MATIRSLKKDIHYVTDEIIQECFMLNYLVPDKNDKLLPTIIAEAVLLDQTAMANINKARLKKNEVKKEINNIRINTLKEFAVLIEKLKNA